jgi:hypothetical protein
MGTFSTIVVLGTTKATLMTTMAMVMVVMFFGMAMHEMTRTTRTTGTSVARRTAPNAADIVSVNAGHGEEEGSESDGKIGHHCAVLAVDSLFS